MKIKSIFIIFCLFLSCTFVVSAQNNNDEIFKNDDIITKEEALESMTDKDISEILKKYHSYNEKGVCNYSNIEITQKDIQEFREAYALFPDDYNHYFKSTKWVNRPDGITLSCTYKEEGMFLKGATANAQAANVNNAFRLLKNKHGKDKQWKNTESMLAQFHCHAVTIGKIKNPWNIEPWRTETNVVVISKRCNPK